MKLIYHTLSLKRRLLLTLLLPLCGILLVLGTSGAWLTSLMVQGASDRVLSGSLQAISETLSMQEGYLTLDLPPSALGMLENSDRDNVYYSIRYRGKLVTGYPELPAENPGPPLEEIRFSDSTFHGVPIRVATEAKLVPQLSFPVIVQVAETTKNRSSVAHRMQLSLIAGEAFLLVVIASLMFLAVNWGLRPLAILSKDVEARSNDDELDFAPLPMSSVPLEAAPLVSAINDLLGHVETSFQTLRRFTSDASHQLRAPLAVVRTHVELLGRQLEDTAGVRGTITDIHNGVKALQHLIVQLISLAKAERPGGEMDESVEFDLVECAAAAGRTYATQALARKMEMSFEASSDCVLVLGNPFFVGEMIANLLDNAIRYGNAGGHIVARVAPGILEIEDDGPGIALEDRERVFERFFRLPQNVDRDGSGLGLPIVQALGRRMGATVRLETPACGKGLKVIVRFRVVNLD
jgi:two-component system, OmpR family, sensor histidine kinase TctE